MPDEASDLLSGRPLRERAKSYVDHSMQRKLLVEFVGCLVFIFIGTCQGTSDGGVIVAAAAHGLTIALLIASIGHISGGHFNPAVTLGVFLTGNIPVINAIMYVISQLAGGFCGSLLACAVLPTTLWEKVGGGATIPPAETMNFAQGILLEAILTYLLVNSVLCSAVDTDSNLLAPFAIGLTVFVDICAGGNISGASMNPARSLGPAIVGQIWNPFTDNSKDSFDMHYIYWAGPAIGAAVASVVYKTFFARDDKRWILN